MDTMSFRIRWRYLTIAAVMVAAVWGVVFGIHKYQMPRIAKRVLQESRTLAASGDTGAARARYADYLSLAPDNSEAYEEYADLVLASSAKTISIRNDSTALSLLDAAVQNGATSEETKVRLIQSAMRLEKYSIAQRMLQRLDLKALQSAEMYAAHGLCDLNAGRPDQAEQAFERALKIDDSCVKAWEGLLEIQADTNKNFEAAELTADKMIAAMPAKGRSAKAWLYIRMDDMEQAGKAFLAAATQLPGEQSYAFDLANFVMRAGVAPIGEDSQMVNFAYSNLQAAYDSEINYDVAFLLGDIAQRLGRLEDSQTHYQMCLERRPADTAAIGRLVEVQSEGGDYASAKNSLKALPDTKGNTTLKAVLLAGLLAKENQFKAASETLEEVIDIAGPDFRTSVHVLLMDYLSKQQRFAEAAEYGYKLLTISGNADTSRTLLVEALVNDQQYREAISQIQSVFSPEHFYTPMLAYLMDHAKQHDLQETLKQEMRAAQKYSRSASLPGIFTARELAETGDFTAARQSLIKNAVSNPEAREYWSQWVLLREEMIQHYSQLDISQGLNAMPTDEARVFACLAAVQRGETDLVVSQVTNHISTNDGTKESLQLAADVVRAIQKLDSAEAAKIMNGVFPDLYRRLREPSGFVTELTSSLMFDLGRHESLLELRKYLVVNDATLRLPSVMADLVGQKKIAALELARDLSVENGISDELRNALAKILETEAVFANSELAELPELIDRLSEYTTQNGLNQSVVAATLRLAAFDESIRPSLAEMGDWLKRKNPNDDYVLHLLSSGLRSARRYKESLNASYQAFEKNQNPVYLLHASYTLWLLNRPEKSRATLHLAFKAGLESTNLDHLDQKLLQRMLRDTEFQEMDLTAR